MAKRKAVHRYAFLTKSYVATVAVIAAFWLACAYSFFQVKDVEPLQGFVPHEILGIAADAPLAKVKKAYRKLAVKFHPDKVLDLGEAHKKQARERFDAIQAAYEQIKSDRGFK